MEYNDQGVRVGPSAIGLGVFALREFAVDEMLGPIEGSVMDDLQYESDYCMELGERGALEPAPPFRYVNHSCQPNCELIEVEPAEPGQHPSLWLKVQTEIAPGDELTIDYGWPAKSATPCRCGSPDCRHWIVAADEVDQVVRP